METYNNKFSSYLTNDNRTLGSNLSYNSFKKLINSCTEDYAEIKKLLIDFDNQIINFYEGGIVNLENEEIFINIHLFNCECYIHTDFANLDINIIETKLFSQLLSLILSTNILWN